MMVYASVFGCLAPCTVIAAALSHQTPFLSSIDKRTQIKNAKVKLATGGSDLFTVYNAYTRWLQARTQGRQAERRFLEEHFLKRAGLQTIHDLAREHMRLLRAAGFARDDCNRFAGIACMGMCTR